MVRHAKILGFETITYFIKIIVSSCTARGYAAAVPRIDCRSSGTEQGGEPEAPLQGGAPHGIPQGSERVQCVTLVEVETGATPS
jgi:hypothetical protein